MKPRIAIARLRPFPGTCPRFLLWPRQQIQPTRTFTASPHRFNRTSTTSPNTLTIPTTPTPPDSHSNAPDTQHPSAPSQEPLAPAYPSLTEQLKKFIQTQGPIPLAHYMRQCLTSSSGGYYTTPRDPDSSETTDQFGSKGDFITSPEISQMFGEMVGLWLVTEWMGQGRRKEGVVIVELGPGRGTLMGDVLRTLRNFKPMQAALEKIYLVEASPELRETQKRVLCGQEAVMTDLPDGLGWTAKSKYDGIPVVWYEDLKFVPTDATKSPFFIAHEFFDALPIHAFQATKDGWKELLVSHKSIHAPPAESQSPKHAGTEDEQKDGDEFHLIVSPTPTKYSTILPTISPRFTRLLSQFQQPSSPSTPLTIEISPESIHLTTFLSRHIGHSHSGAALFIDYYSSPIPSLPPSNTLRAIRSHKHVSPFRDPGKADLSADVDFVLLAEKACEASSAVEVHGPVEQGLWLGAMGMRERARMLAGGDEVGGKRDREDWGKEEEVWKAARRLMDMSGEYGGMGRVYKVLAIVPERGGRRPVGFGGGIVKGWE